MASNYFFIQDRTNSDRKFKNLQHQLWDHFQEYLRSGSPTLLLTQYLSDHTLSLPKGPKFTSNSQLCAIPTPTGLKVYIPGKGDFFFREEMIDGKRPPFQNNGQPNQYGVIDTVGLHNGKSSFTHSWDSIFPAIELICLRAINDVRYFENTDITAPENADFKLEYAACEIQWLLSCSRFYLACCANTSSYTHISVHVYQYAMTEMSVIGLLLYQSKCGASGEQVQQWIRNCGSPFDIVKPSATDCGGMASFVSVFGIQIETKNRGGMRVPGERKTKFIKSQFAGLYVGPASTSSPSNPSPTKTAAPSNATTPPLFTNMNISMTSPNNVQDDIDDDETM